MKSIGFESEAALVKDIIACVARARRPGYRVELEVDAGVGIADLVLAKRSPRSTKALRAAAMVSPRIAVLLKQGVGDAIKSRAELAAFLGASEGAAQRVIAQLSEAGVATQSKDSLTISGLKAPPFERLIAVEAKISDWQRVLVQAYRNLQFADESWVVLDHAFARPAIAQLERFRLAGVGLATIKREQGLLIHHTAGTQGPMSLAKRWHAQSVLSTRALSRKAVSASA